MENALIFGNGFVGNRLSVELDIPIATDRIYSFQDIMDQIKRRKAKTIINCIGYTGNNNVDDCEKNPLKTINANVTMATYMGEACLRTNTRLKHLILKLKHKNSASQSPKLAQIMKQILL